MTKVKFSKWNNKVKPGDDLEKIAFKCLDQRVSAVRYYLRLAAQRPQENYEYVHQLRVWSRRSVATLQLYRDHLQQGACTKLNKHLKKIRKAAGNARDYDVLIKKYKIGRNPETRLFVSFLKKQRKLSQPRITKIFNKLDKGKKLSKPLSNIKRQLKKNTYKEKAQASDFTEWARSHIQPLVTEFFDSIPNDTGNLEQLHKFRIRGKRLRYAMELTTAAFPRKFIKELYPEVEALLTKLGSINDSAMMLKRLENWMRSSTESDLLTCFKHLYTKEKYKLKAELDELRIWWNLEHIESLHNDFNGLLCMKYHQAAVA